MQHALYLTKTNEVFFWKYQFIKCISNKQITSFEIYAYISNPVNI